MDISHEGVLQKWTNYLLGWKSMYFVLHDGLLEYCKQKGNQPKGKISLSTLEVRKHPKNDCVLIVDTGTAKFQLKGQNLKDTQKWYESLKKATSIKKSEAYSTAAAKHKSTITTKSIQ